MSFFPLLVSLVLSYQESGSSGARELLGKAFDYKKIKNKLWYIPIFLGNPLVFFLSYVIMRFTGSPLPALEIPLFMAPLFFIIFFFGAIGEEIGWMGYAMEPLENRWGSFRAALVIGVVWAVWHFIPDMQLGHPLSWVLWHRLGTVALRVLIVWIYNNTGKSVFSAIVFHDMNNVSWALFPNFGSHYDPMITSTILLLCAVIVAAAWRSTGLRTVKLSPKR